MSADGSRRRSRLAVSLVVAAWILAAVMAPVILALAHMKASDTGSGLLPQDATTSARNSRIAEAFPGADTNAIAYLVLESRDELGPADQQHIDAAVSALRADTDHVGSVLDWWSDPLTAALGTSPDGRSAIAMVWLHGEVGTPQARESLAAVRSVVRKLPPSAGLHARIFAPETTSRVPFDMAAWQGAVIVIGALVIAGLRLMRARLGAISVGMALVTVGLSRTVAWPLVTLTTVSRGGYLPVFSETLASVLTIGIITASTMLVGRLGHEPSTSATQPRPYRDMLPALALPGACVVVITGPLLLAQTPALHSVGAAALSAVVALTASLTLVPALIGLTPPAESSVEAASRQSSLRTSAASWARRLPKPSFVNPVVATALVLAICALPVLGARSSITSAANPAGTSSTRFLPGNPLPDVVVITADRDLRDPAALIAIDQVSHRLMEIPAVRKVESAAWPAGIPWPDASLTSDAGALADQLNRSAGSFLPQINAIKSLASAVDQVSGAVDQLESTVNVGLAGANQLQQNINSVLSITQNLKGRTADVSKYLDPFRAWISGMALCPDEVLCSAARKVVEPLDSVVTNVATLSNSADRIGAISTKTLGAFSSTPHLVAQMRSTLGQLRSFVPKLEATIQEVMPQLVQVSAFLKGLSTDFADTGEGGFHLSRKELASPSYQHVRQTMFSADGRATRLLVFSEGNHLGLDASDRVQQLEIAAGKAMKYGSLVDSQIMVSGAAQVAAAIRGALWHDVVLLTLTMLAVVTLVGMWRGAVSGVVLGLGMLASYFPALGISIVLWQHLMARELAAAVPLVSFAILAAFGIPYLIATLLVADSATGASASSVSARRAVAPLPMLGALLGAGLLVVSAGSFSAVSQLGAVLVIGLGTLTAVAHLCIPAAVRSRSRAQQTTSAEVPATDR
ncbi:MMPL family transporter [Mycobacterium simiae]|uniref:MMPL family transporter n=1 Tax=Mycobacterium simiae TaxID=1784 RepID=A0A5B1BTB8_MYCSI|nr:MMPL family transporter [Mycobacterium simiae]KAA1250534.1 MMPL family transporter [Mycobacterium simiae]